MVNFITLSIILHALVYMKMKMCTVNIGKRKKAACIIYDKARLHRTFYHPMFHCHVRDGPILKINLVKFRQLQQYATRKISRIPPLPPQSLWVARTHERMLNKISACYCELAELFSILYDIQTEKLQTLKIFYWALFLNSFERECTLLAIFWN